MDIYQVGFEVRDSQQRTVTNPQSTLTKPSNQNPVSVPQYNNVQIPHQVQRLVPRSKRFLPGFVSPFNLILTLLIFCHYAHLLCGLLSCDATLTSRPPPATPHPPPSPRSLSLSLSLSLNLSLSELLFPSPAPTCERAQIAFAPEATIGEGL